ncbi:protein argonaute 4A-like [Salvia divinorum]|uniref:Protein argonaute 4A-like n=1 Tax=Salvia divinorum TaxID=28513 RepID=A0ABD1GD00_SALDI
MELSLQPEILPPPPKTVPLDVVPIRSVHPKESPVMEIAKPKAAPVVSHRPGLKGRRVCLLTNFFKVAVVGALDDFYHYDISIFREDGSEIASKNVRRAVVEELSEMYKQELAGKRLVYDGVGSLFTLGPLPQNVLEFSVVMEGKSIRKGSSVGGGGSPNENDQKRRKLVSCFRTFKVVMSYVSQISMKSLDERSLTVLNTILQQQACRKGCLVVGQSFFLHEQGNYIDLGGGVLGCRGFFSSFRSLQGGLFLNHDVSMTTTIQPGAVVDFLLSYQNVKTPFNIDWSKASRTLKNLRIRVKHLNREFKITGLSEISCKEQKFPLKLRRESDSNGGVQTIQTTKNLPCINVGKPNRAIFFPVELCFLVPLQRNKNELTVYQRTAMVTKSSQKPEELLKILTDVSKRIKHEVETDPVLQSCGISINTLLVQAEGRVLPAPRLKMGNGEHIIPRNGWWNNKDKKLLDPKKLENWVVVNFSTSCDVRCLFKEFAKVASAKGMVTSPPACVLDENPKNRKKPPSDRVDMMFQQLQSRFKQHPPKFIICLLSDKKFSDLYGPWKRKTLIEFGIQNQCLSTIKIDELYLINVLLKINMKLGGLNHAVVSELMRTMPLVSKAPTMILGIHVSHASPGRAEAPSVASVVGSREWPRMSSYRASLRALPPKSQMIDSLFKPMSEQMDAGIIRELLKEFHSSSGQKKPAQIIIFRNGLSISQFKEFLNVELDQIRKACSFLEANWRPKFTVIVSQRRHHTKFFEADLGANVPSGTIVDSKVCDVQCTNFYMCPHTARIGTSRPTHYHVLVDEIGFTSDDLQELIHSSSYMFQRCNRAISEVAPVRYARLAASLMSLAVKPEEMANASEGYQLPKLHKNVASSMFFI